MAEEAKNAPENQSLLQRLAADIKNRWDRWLIGTTGFVALAAAISIGTVRYKEREKEERENDAYPTYIKLMESQGAPPEMLNTPASKTFFIRDEDQKILAAYQYLKMDPEYGKNNQSLFIVLKPGADAKVTPDGISCGGQTIPYSREIQNQNWVTIDVSENARLEVEKIISARTKWAEKEKGISPGPLNMSVSGSGELDLRELKGSPGFADILFGGHFNIIGNQDPQIRMNLKNIDALGDVYILDLNGDDGPAGKGLTLFEKETSISIGRFQPGRAESAEFRINGANVKTREDLQKLGVRLAPEPEKEPEQAKPDKDNNMESMRKDGKDWRAEVKKSPPSFGRG